VTGQVLNPGTLAFRSNATARDYLRQTGGFSKSADQKRLFLVLPDGSARPLQVSAWNYRQESIPPGSVIVVPRDAAPLTGLLLTERIAGIVSNLALSAAALVTINK
jgi:protein involved in polysaccharide export with SLBB domain